MSIEQQVRATLAARADVVDPTPLYGPALRERASAHRRRTVRRGLVTAVTVAATLAAVLVVPNALRRESLPPASGTVDTWPARGDLASDASLATAAKAAWEAAPVLPQELPHNNVRVLLATRTEFGRYVVLTGFNRFGNRRLAVLSDDPRDHAPYAARLRLRSDVPFPEKDDLLGYRSVRTVNGEDRALLLVVGPPDVTEMRWRDHSKSWRVLPSNEGVATAVVDSGYPDVRLRAYRGTRRVAQQPVTERLFSGLYDPDDALVPPEPPDAESCDDGVCTHAISGSMSAMPMQDGELRAVFRAEDLLWEDMSDQGEQLWLNWALGGRSMRSGGGGPRFSGLLPDETGVDLSFPRVNEGPMHLVLYVDRPEWRIGRLYLARPVDEDTPLRSLSALVPGREGVRLVVFAGTRVGVRYRVGSGPWRALAITEGIGSVSLGSGVDPAAVEVETTFDGLTEIRGVDTYGEIEPR